VRRTGESGTHALLPDLCAFPPGWRISSAASLCWTPCPEIVCTKQPPAPACLSLSILGQVGGSVHPQPASRLSLPAGRTETPAALLLARKVPQDVWDVPSMGFDFPLMAFLSADDFQLVRRYLLHGGWAQWQVLAPGGWPSMAAVSSQVNNHSASGSGRWWCWPPGWKDMSIENRGAGRGFFDYASTKPRCRH